MQDVQPQAATIPMRTSRVQITRLQLSYSATIAAIRLERRNHCAGDVSSDAAQDVYLTLTRASTVETVPRDTDLLIPLRNFFLFQSTPPKIGPLFPSARGDGIAVVWECMNECDEN